MNSRSAAILLAALASGAAGAQSQGMAGMQDMPGMGHDMTSALGPYAMAREGSGTSWQPENFGMEGVMFGAAGWSGMVHGFADTVYDDQGGPRGSRKAFTESMVMAMASRLLGPGTLGVHAMLSLDPTIGRSGYPLLFQTGETANGHDPLVDRQHPHDAFMELSGSYSVTWGGAGAVFVYAGLPGEPALGPSTFMHRFSGERIPEAPITHHWLDATHITMGVVTLGASQGPWKVEASRFNGREPDQNRWNIEHRALDSTSARLTYNPVPEWSMQVSYGDIRSPEQLEPDVRVKRTTASVMHQAMLGEGRWATTLAWGRNSRSGPDVSRSVDGWLLESTYEINARHTVFGRVERVDNDELLDHHDPRSGEAFSVAKVSLGYVYDFARTGPVKWGVGALGSAYDVPAPLRGDYGSHPTSWMAFLQARF